MKLKYLITLSLFLGFTAFFNCSGEDPSSQAFVHVTMMDNAFHPPVIKTYKGGKIRFVNEGNNPHNAIGIDKSWTTEKTYGQAAMFRGAQTDVYFPEDGVFPYFCSFHSSPDGKVGMTGVAVIGNATFQTQSQNFKSKISKNWSGKTRKVPSQYPTIQNAVDAASPGDLILIAKGIFKEEVVVTTPSLVIRGEDRNETIIDGEFLRGNGIMVVGADGVAVENLTTRNATLNGVYWTGVTGYRGSYLTAYNNGDYGIYAFDAVDGLIEHSYGSGSPDSGFYIGQCNPCNAIINDVVSENNALGYSGTNSSGNLYLLSSVWRDNQLGIGPNTLDRELLPPQKSMVIKKNLVYDNNNLDAPSKKLEIPSIGNGIGVLGGLENIVENNVVFNHKNYGILVAMNIDENIWISNNNIVRNNTVFSSGRGDIALSGPVGVGNCFKDNTYHVSSPPMLETMQGCGKIRYPWVADLSSTIGLLALFVQASLGDFTLGNYKNQPIPPNQETMPIDFAKSIKPAHDVFVSNQYLIEKAELPAITKMEVERYQKETSLFTTAHRVHYPGTFKTWFFHLIGYLLPFSIFASWTGLAMLDLYSRNKKTGFGMMHWIILLVPFVGSIITLYAKESSVPRRITNSIVFGGIGFFFTILILAVYAITRVSAPTA
ncbi:plastocyanin [Leptospira ognonensis]|uniref:Plastocyanin n=1 Tax=Leptospira ognonensis TaxID=2484945 RepID=A0A4R9K9Z4_9LEPT|nr:right-handed parallel beta-helix repeat-containing protein [Leptospira ognonensis]TGL62280.1 plastocyanin [Leptospira ognonensis]